MLPRDVNMQYPVAWLSTFLAPERPQIGFEQVVAIQIRDDEVETYFGHVAGQF